MIQEQWRSRKSSFVQLWNQASLQADGSHAELAWKRITDGYSEPHRYYHSQRHILECLKKFDLVKNSLDDSDSVELAIWFHDLILEPSADDNEYQSMLLFQELAQPLLPEKLIDKVCSLIMSTRHIDAPTHHDESCVQDIDLSSMGGAWDDFVRDVEDLRKEYHYLTEEQFTEGIQSFYRKMLDRDKIYSSDYFNALCEDKARANIRRYREEKLT